MNLCSTDLTLLLFDEKLKVNLERYVDFIVQFY